MGTVLSFTYQRWSAVSLWLRTHSVMSTFPCDTWWTCVSIHLISTSFRTPPPPLVVFIKKYWYRIKLPLLSLLFSFYNGIVTCKRVVSFLSSHPQYLSWTIASIYGHLNNNTVTVCWWKNKRIRSTFQHPGCHPVQLMKWFIFEVNKCPSRNYPHALPLVIDCASSCLGFAHCPLTSLF